MLDDLTQVNVGLPMIQGNKSKLAAIDDDNEDDEFEDRMPRKPRGVTGLSSEDDGMGADGLGNRGRLGKDMS